MCEYMRKSAFLRQEKEEKMRILQALRERERVAFERIGSDYYEDAQEAMGVYRIITRDLETCATQIYQLEELLGKAEELERAEMRDYLKDEWESGEEYEDDTNDIEEGEE